MHDMLMGKAKVYAHDHEWEQFLNKLGLTARPINQVFGPEGKHLKFLAPLQEDPAKHSPKVEVHTVRPAFRGGREGRQIEQVLVTLTQQIRVNIGDDDTPETFVFRGGCSLILSLGTLNEVEYIVVKRITSFRRFKAQLAYLTGETENATAFNAYADRRDRRINFRLLHQ